MPQAGQARRVEGRTFRIAGVQLSVWSISAASAAPYRVDAVERAGLRLVRLADLLTTYAMAR